MKSGPKIMKESPIIIGESFTLESKILKHQRPIHIALPDNYKESETRFPVLVVLDGEMMFRLISGIIQMYFAMGEIIPIIVAALPNVNRNEDFDPETGAADNFLKFIELEFLPFLDSRYRTEPLRILYGHSYLGMFTVHTLLKAPHLFDAYIAASPSLRWDKELLTSPGLFENFPTQRKLLYITAAGDEKEGLETGVRKLIARVGNEAPENLSYTFKLNEHENHNTNALKSFSDGLEIIKAWYLEKR